MGNTHRQEGMKSEETLRLFEGRVGRGNGAQGSERMKWIVLETQKGFKKEGVIGSAKKDDPCEWTSREDPDRICFRGTVGASLEGLRENRRDIRDREYWQISSDKSKRDQWRPSWKEMWESEEDWKRWSQGLFFFWFYFHSEIRWKASTEREDEEDMSGVLGRSRKCEMSAKSLLLKVWPWPAPEVSTVLELVRNAESQASPQG